MNNKASRIILFAEAIVLCLPLTYLFVFKLIPAELYYLGDNQIEPPTTTALVALIILSGLVAGWRLIISFVIFGRSHLKQLSLAWWVIAGILTILSVASLIHVSFASKNSPSSFNSFGWGIFFVLPYVHLLIERFRTNSTNKSLNQIGAENAPPGQLKR